MLARLNQNTNMIFCSFADLLWCCGSSTETELLLLCQRRGSSQSNCNHIQSSHSLSNNHNIYSHNPNATPANHFRPIALYTIQSTAQSTSSFSREVTLAIESPFMPAAMYHGKRFLEPVSSLIDNSSFTSSVYHMPTPITTPTESCNPMLSFEDTDWPARTFGQLLLERYATSSHSSSSHSGDVSSTDSSSLSLGKAITPTPSLLSSLNDLASPLLGSFASQSQPLHSALGASKFSDSDATICSAASSLESL